MNNKIKTRNLTKEQAKQNSKVLKAALKYLGVKREETMVKAHHYSAYSMLLIHTFGPRSEQIEEILKGLTE